MNYSVFLGLGSNLGDSLSLLQSAIDALDAQQGVTVVRCSSVYRSRPLAEMDQPDYYNMVIACETDLEPEALLDVTQSIENQLGRVRDGERWGPRTLDIDILAWDQQIIKTARLMVPHPGICERDFVLFPWRDIAPDFRLPLLASIEQLAQQCEDRGLERLEHYGQEKT